MDIVELLQRRRMVRSFSGAPVDDALLRGLCETALWSPTAGNAAGVRFSIVPHEGVATFFTVATDEEWRTTSPRYDGLARAGAVVLVTTRPQDYESRYQAPDKVNSGLGERDAWPVPYWHGDAAMATMSLLLLLENSELQATLWGNFRRDQDILTWAGHVDEKLFASILIGYGDGNDHRSASLERPVPSRAERVRLLKL